MNNATVGKHPCPECGGDLVWNADKQSLACPYCGTIVPWKNAEKVLPGDIQENDLVTALKEHPQDQRGWGEQRREVKCESCQAISVFVDGKVAQRCDFCGSPSIIAHESERDAITPQYVLPFKISDGQVRDAIRKWYGTHWFAPNKLKKMALTDTLHGIYLPYWTFDAHVKANWTADAGYYYYTSQSYTDSKGQSQTRQVRETRWEDAAGKIEHFFDDRLVPGTAGVKAELLREIEPFPTMTDLKAYSAEFVRGWTVERYQIDLTKAAGLNQQDMDAQTKEICARKVPGDTYANLKVNAQYQGRTFKHVLVPVWLVSYTYGSKNFQVIVNGYTGKLTGEYPMSWVKIFFAIVFAIIILGFILMVFGDSN
jgi:DNA-directed RNA polymerase subunit M/transcription elongation factor TFIIS